MEIKPRHSLSFLLCVAVCRQKGGRKEKCEGKHKFVNLQYNIRLDACFLDLFYFHNFLQNSLQKSFPFVILFLYNFTKIKIKSFECPKCTCQKPTVLFSIYQNNTWTIRRLVDEMINPATQRIILKIVRFQYMAV